jgi:hypothetical protein
VNSWIGSIRRLHTKIDKGWEKNGADVRSILTRSLPRFLVDGREKSLEDEIPVFVFHSVFPEVFESQLRYLTENNYETLNAAAFLEVMKKGIRGSHRLAVLTFDDATASSWTVAYPLLKKYGFQAVLFAIPGLVPEGEVPSPTIEQVWSGQAGEEVLQRERHQPMCTWAELREMEKSGHFDIQAHSMTHARIFISPQVVDFINPGFDPWIFGNVNVPLGRDESVRCPKRDLHLGQPVYASASRLSARLRYLENRPVSQELVSFVQEKGGQSFFQRKNWRSELMSLHQKLSHHYQGEDGHEEPQDREEAIRWEINEPRLVLKEKLGGKRVEHFCNPWHQGSTLSDQAAGESGYQAVYYGLESGKNGQKSNGDLLKIRRVSEEYLCCLPGKGSQWMYQVWANKVIGTIKKKRKG